jgi:putative spermidine/putrescine transport system permease protein
MISGTWSKRVVLLGIVFFNLAFLSLPTLIVVGTSFTAADFISFPPKGFSLRWYGELFESPEYQGAFLRSLYVAIISLVAAGPTGLLVAIAMYRYRLRLSGLLKVYFLLPFTVPLVASGISMLILFGELNVLGQLWPVGVALGTVNIPFMIWAVGVSVEALNPDLEDAAANLGAPRLQTFFLVTMPALMPGIITGSLIVFMLAMNEFLVSLLLVDRRIITLPVQIFLSVRSVVTPDLAAVSVVYIVFAAIAIWIVDRWVGLELFLKSRQSD